MFTNAVIKYIERKYICIGIFIYIYFSKAADQGHIYAQYNLAYMYGTEEFAIAKGASPIKHIEKAIEYHIKSADQGLLDSVRALAV